MTDSQFMFQIKRNSKIAKKHYEIKTVLETEYKRRYGHHPMEMHDPIWIETVHKGNIMPTMRQIDESATKCTQMESNKEFWQ